MHERLTHDREPAGGEESDAGEASPTGGQSWEFAEIEDLRDGPPPGWHAKTVAIGDTAAKTKKPPAEIDYEKLPEDDSGEDHIIRGHD